MEYHPVLLEFKKWARDVGSEVVNSPVSVCMRIVSLSNLAIQYTWCAWDSELDTKSASNCWGDILLLSNTGNTYKYKGIKQNIKLN